MLVSQERRKNSSSKFRSNSTRRRTTIKVDLKSSRCNVPIIRISAIRTATSTTACLRRGREVSKLRILFPRAKTDSLAGTFSKTRVSVTSSFNRKESWDQCQPIQQLQFQTTQNSCLAIIKSSTCILISSTLALRQIILNRYNRMRTRTHRMRTRSPCKVWAATKKTLPIRLSLSRKLRTLLRLKRRMLRRLMRTRLRILLLRRQSLKSLILPRLRRPSWTRMRILLRRRLRSLLSRQLCRRAWPRWRTSLRVTRSLTFRRNPWPGRLLNKSKQTRSRRSRRKSWKSSWRSSRRRKRRKSTTQKRSWRTKISKYHRTIS